MIRTLLTLLLVLLAAPVLAEDLKTPGRFVNEGQALDDRVGAGVIPYQLPADRFARNTDVGTTEEDIWGGAALSTQMYFPSAPEQMYVSSDNAGDTMSLFIEGLVDDPGAGQYIYATEVIALAGLTFTATANEYVRINTVTVLGSTAPAGNIYVHTDSADAATADGIPDIPASQLLATFDGTGNVSQLGRYSVPDGWTFLLDRLAIESRSGGANTFCTVNLYARAFGTGESVWYLRRQFSVNSGGPISFNRPRPTAVVGPADLRVATFCSSTGRVVGVFVQARIAEHGPL